MISAGLRIHKHKASWSETVTILHCLYLPEQQEKHKLSPLLGTATIEEDVCMSLMHCNDELANWPSISQGEETDKHMISSCPQITLR